MATTERDYYELLGVARDASETEIKKAFRGDRKSTRLNSSHDQISYAVFCLKKKKIYAILSWISSRKPAWETSTATSTSPSPRAVLRIDSSRSPGVPHLNLTRYDSVQRPPAA